MLLDAEVEVELEGRRHVLVSAANNALSTELSLVTDAGVLLLLLAPEAGGRFWANPE